MSKTTGPSAAELIDLERYPIHDLDCAAGRRLLTRCQRDLQDRALCALRDFIRPAQLAAMTEEASALTPRAYYLSEESPPYFNCEDSDSAPPDHLLKMTVKNSYRQVLSEQILPDSLVRQLYLWAPLIEFVRRVFGAETLYPSDCPHLSLTYKIAGEGDTDGWHYDSNDGVVSLLLQKPDRGGLFEYAPYIRSEHDQRFDRVAALLDDPATLAIRPAMEPGTFVFFNGKLSMHRVTPVGPTTRTRIIALLSYDQRPDQIFSPAYVDHLRTFPRDLDEMRGRDDLAECQAPIGLTRRRCAGTRRSAVSPPPITAVRKMINPTTERDD